VYSKPWRTLDTCSWPLYVKRPLHTYIKVETYLKKRGPFWEAVSSEIFSQYPTKFLESVNISPHLEPVPDQIKTVKTSLISFRSSLSFHLGLIFKGDICSYTSSHIYTILSRSVLLYIIILEDLFLLDFSVLRLKKFRSLIKFTQFFSLWRDPA
jgi:hypothetical protein